MVGMDDFRLQLVRHCDSLLESGELTDTDAYDLADWLNKHDEACLKWPGEDLVQIASTDLGGQKSDSNGIAPFGSFVASDPQGMDEDSV